MLASNCLLAHSKIEQKFDFKLFLFVFFRFFFNKYICVHTVYQEHLLKRELLSFHVQCLSIPSLLLISKNCSVSITESFQLLINPSPMKKILYNVAKECGSQKVMRDCKRWILINWMELISFVYGLDAFFRSVKFEYKEVVAEKGSDLLLLNLRWTKTFANYRSHETVHTVRAFEFGTMLREMCIQFKVANSENLKFVGLMCVDTDLDMRLCAIGTIWSFQSEQQ